MGILHITLAALALTTAQAQTPAQTPSQILEAAPEEVWQAVDPENLLVMDLPSGTMLIELRPDLAQQHVERVKSLTRQGFYDGTVFHRVIEGFMAQGGDPTATGTGGSTLPNLPGEFARPVAGLDAFVPLGRDNRAAQIGFLGSVPVGAQPATLPGLLVEDTVALWGLHCPGVMSMARAGDPNSANSQFFVMFGDNRSSLDQRYTVWGRVVDGQRNTRRINRGEPPARPTPIVRMRIAADIPVEDRPAVEVLRSDSETFTAWLRSTGALSSTGFFRDVCNVTVPVRVNKEITS
ncbi:peptidylprolyl isomerase [Parvularcula dongshanensis]|uniref:peptidylprolyl isomerase n=1 Tax=Parvularcula dongshanensis TaxID=1173995 RepID=A0A840I0X1_9PROT|nr:peptidylprolyl isomerase [Parvularcula dongshanensis]MBB4658479.1 peptidylprolyl isomerase [Parvularcula dongshanensis]